MDISGERPGRCLSVIIAIFVTLCLIVANVLLAVHGAATNIRLYEQLWLRYDVSAETGMNMSELTRTGESLIGYFTGKLPSPQIETTIFGQKRPLYNSEEIAHLVDVKNLFQTGLTAEWVSMAAAFAGTMFLVATTNRRAASRAFYASGFLTLLAIALLAIPAASDFTGWWTNFHLLTFTNDLWLLNPATDWLIKMFPETFFFSMVERIGLHAGITALLLLLAGFLFGRRQK